MKTFACDFETTVFDGQTSTEVWSSALVELHTEDVIVHHSINETFKFLNELKSDCTLYYHNLKFDGSFWLDFLIKHKNYSPAITYFNDDESQGEWMKDKDMPKGSYKYMISNMGQWYTMTIKLLNGKIITLKDSYKLMPFTLKKIGEAFHTEHQKLDMEYTGYRYAGCTITDEEMEYIKNDVLVLKEALEFMFKEGHDKLTIGSCCLHEFKNSRNSLWMDKTEYNHLFPNLEEIGLDEERFGAPNVDRYIRNSYGGGWCYVVKGKENLIKTDGCTADVNSLYPSMMHSESGNYYPVGVPTFWSGNYIPKEAETKYRAHCDNRRMCLLDYEPKVGSTITHTEDVIPPSTWTAKVLSVEPVYRYYFVRIKCRFYIKDGMLPFIHIRNKYIYNSNENLITSDYYDRKKGEYFTHYVDNNGVRHSTDIILTLTQTDFKLLRDHYNLPKEHFAILDGCYFSAEKGIFDPYINKWAEIKKNSKGAMRTLAKLFLNNLYGKMASSSDSSFKVAFMDEKGIHFRTLEAHDKPIGYIPIGSAITSYARNFTIRTAQANYYGVNERGFIYADTDSIHCDLSVEELKNVPIHPVNFCCWKIENEWDKALFVRQKTYIEHTTAEDQHPIDNPYYMVKCAGMPKKCKDLFVWSMEQNIEQKDYDKLSEDGKEFVKVKRELSDFRLGLRVPEKLMPKRIDGGVLLVNSWYEMR